MRVPDLEKGSNVKIDIKNDLNNFFDYETLENKVYNDQEAVNWIKNQIIKEVNLINPNWQEVFAWG